MLWQRPRDQYNGLLMRCSPGLHEAAFKLMAQYQPHEDPRVLELACGSGAMSARLRDHGYTRIELVDGDTQQFGLDGLTPRQMDLNTQFSKALEGQFDLIVALEIIEHLDSPRQFLREIRSLITPGGTAIISTPNLSHWANRVTFAAKAEHRFFDRQQYETIRHVSPITHLQMQTMFEEVGLELVKRQTAGSFFGPMKHMVAAPLWLPMYCIAGKQTFGDVAVYVARCP